MWKWHHELWNYDCCEPMWYSNKQSFKAVEAFQTKLWSVHNWHTYSLHTATAGDTAWNTTDIVCVHFHSDWKGTIRVAWKLLGMLELIVGWLFWTIKHANKWLFTSNCHFNATLRPSRASSGIQLYAWRSPWRAKRCIEVTIGSEESFVGVLDRPK